MTQYRVTVQWQTKMCAPMEQDYLLLSATSGAAALQAVQMAWNEHPQAVGVFAKAISISTPEVQ